MLQISSPENAAVGNQGRATQASPALIVDASGGIVMRCFRGFGSTLIALFANSMSAFPFLGKC